MNNEDAIPTVELYLEALNEICAIIYYQSSLKEQDRWLNSMIEKGVWTPDE